MTPSLKEKIQQEAEVKALMERDRLPPDLPFTRKDDYRAGYAEGYEAGVEAILSNPGEYGLAGRWRTPEEKMPPQNKRVLVEFKSGDCQMYELSVDANAIRAWWIRNVKRWLDESEPAPAPEYNRDENSPQGKAAIAFYNWMESASMSNAKIPLEIKWRMFADQKNAKK